MRRPKARTCGEAANEGDGRESRLLRRLPPRKGRSTERHYDREKYKWRYLIENFFCRIKEFKKIAMRCEKTDESFAANIYLAATVLRVV
ncbi:transposase [Neisseria bacilliformis]|nr:transposase [Neisseria bacilliformis]QMT48746.1 transposase [Neisseria bacilliformis]